jgi:hypothetical protein
MGSLTVTEAAAHALRQERDEIGMTGFAVRIALEPALSNGNGSAPAVHLHFVPESTPGDQRAEGPDDIEVYVDRGLLDALGDRVLDLKGEDPGAPGPSLVLRAPR